MLAMANAGKRGGKGTNGSQFFITVGETAAPNGKHTIFGEVADGPSREVVDKIARVATERETGPSRTSSSSGRRRGLTRRTRSAGSRAPAIRWRHTSNC